MLMNTRGHCSKQSVITIISEHEAIVIIWLDVQATPIIILLNVNNCD